MKIQDIMTPDPLTVTDDAGLDEAMTLMDERDVRHLPVVDAAGEVVGVVSDRDIVGANGWLPWRIHERLDPRSHEPRVRDVMRPEPVTVTAEDDVLLAAGEMLSRTLGCLPVLNGRKLVGIVSDTDLIRAFRKRCRERDDDAFDPPVSGRMSGHATEVPWSTTIGQALDVCHSAGIRHLPVVENGLLVGILSDRDLRRALGSRRDLESPIEEVMSRRVFTVEPEDRLSAACDVMLDHKISAVPVVADATPVGILTTTDLLDHFLSVLGDSE
jgi:CBS domain-containing protein